MKSIKMRKFSTVQKLTSAKRHESALFLFLHLTRHIFKPFG